jgi:hypothetical protein
VDRDLAEISEPERPALVGKRAPATLGAAQLLSERLGLGVAMGDPYWDPSFDFTRGVTTRRFDAC